MEQNIWKDNEDNTRELDGWGGGYKGLLQENMEFLLIYFLVKELVGQGVSN